jgi:DNA-binding MarR family transcriptional regulator
MARIANLLGALSLVVADRMTDALTEACGHSLTAAAALSAMLHFLDRPSVDRLRQVLGLTPSGTVRLVDRLEESGYVVRGPGDDARSTALSLTEEGRRVAQAASSARADVLVNLVAGLDPSERDGLDRIAAKLLVSMKRKPGATRWICRVCDTGACGRYKGLCPFVPPAGSGQ